MLVDVFVFGAVVCYWWLSGTRVLSLLVVYGLSFLIGWWLLFIGCLFIGFELYLMVLVVNGLSCFVLVVVCWPSLLSLLVVLLFVLSLLVWVVSFWCCFCCFLFFGAVVCY